MSIRFNEEVKGRFPRSILVRPQDVMWSLDITAYRQPMANPAIGAQPNRTLAITTT